MSPGDRVAASKTTAAQHTDAPTSHFEAVSVVLPVIDETTSLEATVAQLVTNLGSDLGELILVVSPRTTATSRATIAQLVDMLGGRVARAEDADGGPPEGRQAVPIVVHEQVLPRLGGALREAFELARCSHLVMMASDLETDPAAVKAMVVESKANPGAVITATRWAGARSGRFTDYDPLKLVFNGAFQRLLAVIYRSRLTDLTYGFRLFPSALVQSIHWEELGHPFLLETVLKPLRLGIEVIEVPTTWRARVEGQSSNSFVANFAYVRTAVRVRLAKRASLWRGGSSSQPPGSATRREPFGGAQRRVS